MFFLAFSGGVAGIPLPAFAAYAAGHAILYILVFHIVPQPPGARNGREGPRGAGPLCLFGTGGIVATALILRLAFLAYPPSDDINRYIWEGRIQHRGMNPYTTAPAHSASDFAGDPIFEGINHKNVTTAYPPFALMLCRFLAGLAKDEGTTGLQPVLIFKLFFILCDILIVLILAALLASWKRPAHWLALYAWNPLVLVYGAGEAHLDIVQNLFIVAALAGMRKGGRWAWAMYLFIGCAVLTKYFAIVMLPFLVNRGNRRWLPFFLVPFLAFLPYRDSHMLAGLFTFVVEMHYNGCIPQVLRLLLPQSLYGPAILGVFGGGLWWIWLLKQDRPEPGMAMAWMWLLLCLPTFHPWYLLPLIPFLLFTPNRAWLLLCALVGLNFWVLFHQLHTGQWHEFAWIWLAEFLPFLLLMIVDVKRTGFPWRRKYARPQSFDIVVPTLNEESTLPASLDRLQEAMGNLRDRANNAKDEPTPKVTIYIVDGGSDDRTIEIAERHDVTILKCPDQGRGLQFASGIGAGTGDVVLMLHADANMVPQTLTRLHNTFTRHPALQWGILGHTYTEPSFKMKVIEISNRLRFHLGGVAFGDQGIFVRRSCLSDVGGMPTIRLMEDVEISLRLAACPSRLNLGNCLKVSTRRWKRKRFAGYTLQVLQLVTNFLLMRRLGADIGTVTDRMYQVYYQKMKSN